MLKYRYYLKDSKGNIFSLVNDNVEIERYLKQINGVYVRLAWVLQVNNETKETREYLVHQNRGFITEYALMYKNGRKIK